MKKNVKDNVIMSEIKIMVVVFRVDPIVHKNNILSNGKEKSLIFTHFYFEISYV